ncbi:response regulator [Rhodopirellula sallentina]|uniref:Signal transduction response regulator, receiver region domain protein n=1 Tax=Rhodopirellula sallentina SM41 TaxID=1263870 RepID=M5TXI8_9BACT|nr:response regulator [Rhodopirellula sallentina]EMI53724.1 Signal transduction response regulator, receiver region domain protein [Rhodopirellula sallentina SM41]
MIANVLITDDDADYRETLCDALSRRGLSLHQARDGDEALEVIEREPIHLALLDVHMPRVTGLEVIRVLSERSAPMPYILMSAMMDEEIEREAARMRAYKILHKPIRLKVLRDIVCGGLAETYGWRPS